MKKCILILAAIMAVVLSSCSNEDITVKKSITFKVNPNTVISGFKEYNPGDLTVIDSSFELRVQLLIYNENDQLVTKDVQYFNDYAHIMTSTLELNDGEQYKAIAITDIIQRSEDFEYWTVSDKESLKTLRISNTGYIGSQYNILGIANQDIIVSGTNQINIDVQPAGSLMIVVYDGIKYWSDVSEYQLGINRNADYVTFETSGNPEWNINASSNFDWRISNITVADWADSPEITTIYDYVFSLPYGNTNVRFEALVSSGWLGLTTADSINLGRGSEYFIYCDIENQEMYIEQLTAGRSAIGDSDTLSRSYSNSFKQNIRHDVLKKK